MIDQRKSHNNNEMAAKKSKKNESIKAGVRGVRDSWEGSAIRLQRSDFPLSRLVLVGRESEGKAHICANSKISCDQTRLSTNDKKINIGNSSYSKTKSKRALQRKTRDRFFLSFFEQ